ncbi:MAG: M48 family metallopeptidase, partial [Rhodospirillaceae bacterium]|nr:M48 family metallopeptidase [Rhodospirillaceae bacterium]
LVMAPAFVLDYLVAHEVAHLRQRNHGEKFWKLTQSLSDDMDSAHEWMERHAPELYRYG